MAAGHLQGFEPLGRRGRVRSTARGEEPGASRPDGGRSEDRHPFDEQAVVGLGIPQYHEFPNLRRDVSVRPRVDQESVAGFQDWPHALVENDHPNHPSGPPVGLRGRPGSASARSLPQHLYPEALSRPPMLAARTVPRSYHALRDALVPPLEVHAHCDIPCGIYDPHEAQISALTVVRMMQLIGELPKPGPASKPEELEAYQAKLSRYMAVKESHSERAKSELRILWGDYFTADHAKQHPTLHEAFWKAMKQASKARQGTNLADAQELLTQVQQIAEIFWATKGAKTHRLPSMQKSGGELVYPAPA